MAVAIDRSKGIVRIRFHNASLKEEEGQANLSSTHWLLSRF